MSAFTEPTDTSDIELMGQMARGDTKAFSRFYDRHAALLYSLAKRIVADAHEAEEVLQEALMVIWERASSYDSSFGKPLSWAVAVTRNKAIDRLRSGQRKAVLAAELARRAGGDDAKDESPVRKQTITDETGAIMRDAFGGLPVEQRQAIELAFFGGLSHSEIAVHLGQPLGTIKARIRRGMLALRDALEHRL